MAGAELVIASTDGCALSSPSLQGGLAGTPHTTHGGCTTARVRLEVKWEEVGRGKGSEKDGEGKGEREGKGDGVRGRGRWGGKGEEQSEARFL